jgi:hypothetical protein
LGACLLVASDPGRATLLLVVLLLLGVGCPQVLVLLLGVG